VVLITYSGHGIQHGGKVYLIPGDVNPDGPTRDFETDFFPLSDILRFCKDDLDAQALEMRKKVVFVVIIDACRTDIPDSTTLRSSLDERKSLTPGHWAMCFSCLRDSTAKDGPKGGHSPFVTELLHNVDGVFAEGIALKSGLEKAFHRLRKQYKDQTAFGVALDTIPDDFYIYPQIACEDNQEAGSEIAAASDAACGLIGTELECFLDQVGVIGFLPDLKGQLRIDTLNNLKSAYKRGCLEKWKIEETCAWAKIDLTEAVSRLVSSEAVPLFVVTSEVPSEERLSQAGTPLMASPRSPEVLCLYNEGDPNDLHQHVKNLLGEFNKYYRKVSLNLDDQSYHLSDFDIDIPEEFCGHWTFCMLLWSVFVVGGTKVSNDTADDWRQCLTDFPNQEELLPKIDELIKTGKVGDHSLMDKIKLIVDNDMHSSSRPVAAIAVLDCMVQEHLKEGEKQRWMTNVVKPWYNSSELLADDVLCRANIFLRNFYEGTGGIKILLKAFETGSYAVFATMPSLTSLFFFQHLELKKLGCLQSGKAGSACAAGVAVAPAPLLHGFKLLASSGGCFFHTADTNRPTRNMPAIIQGLRCLAHLRDSDWETLGPVKTAREFLQEEQCVEQCVEQGELWASAQKKSEDECETARDPEREKREKVKKILDVDACDLYLEGLCRRSTLSVGFYLDSASGDERKVGEESIALVLLPCKSFNDNCDKDEDLICPISHGLMQEPVTCSDGKTYERTFIVKAFETKERHFEKMLDKKNSVFEFTSPLTREPLDFVEFHSSSTAVERKLQFNHTVNLCLKNEEIHRRIKTFKVIKLQELRRLKQTAEGEDERRILCNRYGVDLEDGQVLENKTGRRIDSAQAFLEWIVTQPDPFACLTGPPASGKTITMQQIVYFAAEACNARMEEGIDVESDTSMPLLPLFMRAAVLKKLVENSNADEEVTILRQLVALFLDHGIAQKIFPDSTKELILELFDLDQVLICIDGLDEAAEHQGLLEGTIEHAVKEAINQNRRLHVLLSTREHSYVHSRACLRLGDFSVVNLQPLDEERRHEMLRRRLPTENIVIFQGQLAEIARKNPELARSPFLLSLMIEVYKKDGAIPRKRVELYSKQVEVIVTRCMTNKIDGTYEVRSAQKLATKYLETLAFVCQLRLEERDFTLAGCHGHMHELWGADQLESLSESEKNLFERPIVGLLTDVGKTLGGNEAYRFSHLTLQEYLAAKCAVRLYGHDVAQLLSTLQPLHSRWKREVLLFAGCLLQPETMFEDFCRAVLQSDDGTGACCEMVMDFSKERGESAEVAQLVRNKLQEIRGTKTLIAGLCHPSLELRSRVLSEMDTFGMPHDPFSETDGTVAELKTIAQRHDAKWFERAAAILSMVQIAQMEHCQKYDNRTETLRWVLVMLSSNYDENVHYALVKGLGTLLKGRKDGALKLQFDFTFVSADDEKVLLHALGSMVSYSHLAVMEALADLNAYSDGLMEWALRKSLLSDKSLLSEGKWPMRHVLGVFCTKIASDSNHSQAVRLATHLFARVHAGSSKIFETEKDDLHKGLKMMCEIIGADRLQLVLLLLRSGELLQRVRVMEMAADLGMKNFAHESLDELALCLLSKMDAGASSTGKSLLDGMIQHEIKEHAVELMLASLFEKSKVLGFLLDIFKPLAQAGGDPRQVFEQLTGFSQSREEETHQRKPESSSQKSSQANLARPLEPAQNGTTAAIEEEIYTFSRQALANVVANFTPQMLTNDDKTANLLELYCASRLWADSGLIQLDSTTSVDAANYFSEYLALSDAQSVRYTDAFRVITEPWKYADMQDGRWDQAVLELMQDKMLGRILFKHVLLLIGQRQGAMADIEMKTLEADIQQWQPSDATEHVEKQFLLKELSIGKRSQQFPTWTGLVSTQTATIEVRRPSWGGLRVAGLCIGVDEYKHICPLGKAVKDAEEVNKALTKVPGCYSAVLHNPTTRVGLMKSIKRHVQEDAFLDKPPQLFFLYYAGYGIEHNRRVYLVPGDATVDAEDDLVSCVPLDEVMQMFVKEMDTPVLKKLGDAGAITFIVVLDLCRISVANSRSVDVDLEPEKPSCAPCKYTIIFSCSRTMPASVGQRGGHSAFAKAVLDADRGFFAEGITLHSAISNVSSIFKSMTQDQHVLIHGTAGAIPENFCIQPKAMSEPSHILEVEMASEGGGFGCNELAVFLEDHGSLPHVAARISETMQWSVKQFLRLKQGDIDVDDGELSFLKRQHKRLLLALVDSTANNISSRETAFSFSDAQASVADTDAVADTDGRGYGYDADSDWNASVEDGTIVGGYHLGNADEILARLKMFFHGWMDENSFGGASANLSLCTILWIIFLREATYLPSQVGMFERWIDRIFHDDIAHIENDFAIQVHSFVRDLVSHKLLGSIRKTINEFSTRPCVASIAIIDHMVVKLLVVDDVLLDKWNDHVVGGWYRSRVSPPSAFLARANEFIRDYVGSVQLLARVQTQ